MAHISTANTKCVAASACREVANQCGGGHLRCCRCLAGRPHHQTASVERRPQSSDRRLCSAAGGNRPAAASRDEHQGPTPAGGGAGLNVWRPETCGPPPTTTGCVPRPIAGNFGVSWRFLDTAILRLIRIRRQRQLRRNAIQRRCRQRPPRPPDRHR